MRLLDLFPAADGPSRYGFHFIAEYTRCPMEWALHHLPIIEGSPIEGTRPAGEHTKGSAFHQGLASLYTQRCQTPSTGQWCPDHGQWDLDAALQAARLYLLATVDQWPDPEDYERAQAEVADWITRYDRQYGPKGLAPEFPLVQVYCDETGPWVEREFTVPLGPAGLYFTGRLDLVASWQGILGPWDHKTASPSTWSRLFTSLALYGQPTGYLMGLRRQYPQLPAGALMPFVTNAINKRPASKPTLKSPPAFGREATYRTAADLNYFELMATTLLSEMDDRVMSWGFDVDAGVDPIEALGLHFPRVGMFTEVCYRYGRACEFEPLCGAIGHEKGSLSAFKKRPQVVGDSDEAE